MSASRQWPIMAVKHGPKLCRENQRAGARNHRLCSNHHGSNRRDWRDTTPKTLNLALDPTKSFMQSCLILAKKRRVSKLKSLNPKPKLPLWGIQMATGSTRAKAKARYTRNARDCRTVIDGRKPNYIKKSPQVAGLKDYYVARLGAKSRGTAQKLCNRLRKFNCVCVVYKN